jgi:YVTN family beta-propeller protein
MKYLTLFSLLFYANTVFAVTQHAYVTDQLGNAVNVIDVSADTVQSISGFDGPRVVQVSADGTLAYIGSDDNTIRVIDTLTHTVLPVIVNVNHPVAIALTPASDFIYVTSANDTISVVRTSDYTTPAVITGFNNLQDCKVTPDGTRVYATNAGNGTVSVIDTSTNTIVDTITGMIAPIGLTFTVDGTYAYVAETSTNTVYVISTASNTVVDAILGFNLPTYIAAAPDKSTIYISNSGNNTVSIVRTSDNFIIGTIAIPVPKTIGVTEDGLYLYVGSDYETVFKVDTLSNTILAALPGFKNPANIALTTNNEPFISVNACQVRSNPANIYNEISWEAGPGTPTAYSIYRDVNLVHRVVDLPAATLQYQDQHLELGQSYSYYVVAYYANGYVCTIGAVEVSPVRQCLNP